MKSGEFARLCGTTKNTLIHYDEIGLLHPAEKGNNRYRNYSQADLVRFSLIHTMTQAGFSLTQVREMLNTPDPERLAALARDNGKALKKRIAELRRSEQLLAEIGRQASEAIAASLEPGIIECTERYLLVVEELWGDVFSKDASVMEGLASLGPEAAVAPYGVRAYLDDDELPRYDQLFYLLPRKPKNVPLGSIVSLPAGEYASASYVGPWDGVGEVYQRLNAYTQKNSLDTDDFWYEISQGRLLDVDDNHYRCTLFAPLR